MARFILDVANVGDVKYIQKLVTDILCREVATIICIDESNENQFYTEDDKGINNLTTEQIDNFNRVCNEY